MSEQQAAELLDLLRKMAANIAAMRQEHEQRSRLAGLAVCESSPPAPSDLAANPVLAAVFRNVSAPQCPLAPECADPAAEPRGVAAPVPASPSQAKEIGTV